MVNDKEIGPLFKSLSSAEIKGDTLVLKTDPDYLAPSAPEESSKKSFLDRFMVGFSVIAVIFLAIVAAIIILSRRKAKKS